MASISKLLLPRLPLLTNKERKRKETVKHARSPSAGYLLFYLHTTDGTSERTFPKSVARDQYTYNPSKVHISAFSYPE